MAIISAFEFADDSDLRLSDLSRPPQGGYNPQFSCDTPTNHLKFKGDYQGGVYGGVCVIVMEGVINNNKMLYVQNLVILFSGILLNLLPPDVIFCS